MSRMSPSWIAGGGGIESEVVPVATVIGMPVGGAR
jgi:hypothetical protein